MGSPAPLAGARRRSSCVMGGPASALHALTRSMSFAARQDQAASSGHSCLWVIRCSDRAEPSSRSSTWPINSLNRVCSGREPRRRSLSRARSSAEIRHRRGSSRNHRRWLAAPKGDSLSDTSPTSSGGTATLGIGHYRNWSSAQTLPDAALGLFSPNSRRDGGPLSTVRSVQCFPDQQ